MKSPKSKHCVVGIRTANGDLRQAFDVRIEGNDIYVNYSDCSTPEAHKSYHASGQSHTKKGGRYIEWDGVPESRKGRAGSIPAPGTRSCSPATNPELGRS